MYITSIPLNSLFTADFFLNCNDLQSSFLRDRALSSEHLFTLDIFYRQCKNNLIHWLAHDSSLWPYDEIPSKKPIIEF